MQQSNTRYVVDQEQMTASAIEHANNKLSSQNPLPGLARLSFPLLLIVLAAFTTLSNSVVAKPLAIWTVKEVEITKPVYFNAQVEATKAATVSAQTSGRVIAVHYDVNDRVEAGSPLLEITSEEQAAELGTAQAELAKAKAINQEAQATLKRFDKLFPQGAISQGQMDEAIAAANTAEQAVSAAKAQLVKAKQSLNYTTVSAPFSGRVTQRHVEQGETIAYGQALFSGYDDKQLRVSFYVPNSQLSELKQAKTIEIILGSQLTANKQTTITTNNFNVFEFSQANQQHQVRANFNVNNAAQNQVHLGQWLKAGYRSAAQQVISIPNSAIHQVNELTAVYLKVGEQVLLTQVRLGEPLTSAQGETKPNQRMVISGLKPGDQIIEDASAYLLQLAARKGE
ncbi:efflux RND transporter periplasmic adaptor subunit [Shewanella maritima]|nr:efflux RND transporter periplasmic adaptor subunit [Shewanella maritima]